MKLSKYFELSEFVESHTADRLEIDNTPSESEIKNLQYLSVHLLDKIREQFGPVKISSGFRCQALNKAIGGSQKSQHCFGMAADLKFQQGVDKIQVAKWIIDSGLSFDQLILEFYNKQNTGKGWLHVSLVQNGNNRRQVLTAERIRGVTEYTHGLP